MTLPLSIEESQVLPRYALGINTGVTIKLVSPPGDVNELREYKRNFIANGRYTAEQLGIYLINYTAKEKIE